MKRTLVAAAVLAVCAGLLGGCGTSVQTSLGPPSFNYENAERYAAGGADISAAVERVEIQWLSGSVRVADHGEDVVRFLEEANRAMTGDESVRCWLDGATLRIQFCKSGARILNGLEKELTLLLPEELMLKELKISSVSAGVSVDSIRAEALKVSAVSGGVEAAGCAIAKSADFDTTSGTVNAELIGSLRELRASTVSGRTSIAAQRIGEVEMESTSGDLLLSVEQTPDRIDVDTVSGAVTLVLPEDAGVTLRYGTVSGSCSSELPGRADGKRTVFGDGACACSVDTTSGNLRIRKHS